MIAQRVLLKLFTAGLLPGPGRKLLAARPWTVQDGYARGLRIGFPQNLDFVRGSTELPMQACIAGYLRPGDVFYDIGANVGFFSLLAARRVGPAGQVYAFEPVAENAAAIRRNAALNGFTNISVFEIAASDTSGQADLFVTEWDGGSSLSKAAVSADERIEHQTVAVSTIDELAARQGLRPPTLVKIDVEGTECAVLRGMHRTIERHRPAIVYEVDDASRSQLEHRQAELDAFVSGCGYDVRHLEDSYPNVNWFVGHSFATPAGRERKAS